MAAINHPSQQQQYCLKWNSFHSNITDVFQNMLVHENLVDVTLACEGASIKAHKMILAACSPYFQNLFMTNPCKHPIVILKDVKFNDLKAIIDFIYSGEVNIPQDQLNSLLKTAETLKIKGLADFGEKQMLNNNHHHNNNNNHPTNLSMKNAISLNFTNLTNFNRKRKRTRIHYPHHQNSNPNLKLMNGNKDSGGDSSDDDEGNRSTKSSTIEKNLFSNTLTNGGGNGVSIKSPREYKNHSSNHSVQSHQSNIYDQDDNDRDDSEEFEPTKLLEQSMSTLDNTGVDYSPENNAGDVQSGEDDDEDNKGFLDDEYSSNNSNADLNMPPLALNKYEALLSEIQTKNLTTCPICSKEFIKKSKLIRHYHTHFSDFRPKFSCVFCGKLFTTQDWCKRHALNCQLKHYQQISQLDLYNE
ncbi:Dolichyl-diphosphooligosaccharide-protein glycosyltransferase subunit 2 [Sarcoptes scabiei]|nr:Dolichyl-diphosphooligosaccharide-protein glycosyltransferase subunit 2 [Sarcoptes scabiei]